MKKTLLRLVTLTSALTPGIAGAIGFGDIVLQSRVGEPLRAEVSLIGASSEELKTACFSLHPLPGSDLPVVTAAKTRLIQRGLSFYLQISGNNPIAEPIFVIGLKAACGVNLERDYVLMPEAPSPSLARVDVTYSAPDIATSRPSGSLGEWQTKAGESLESIAESQHSGNLAKQRRQLASLKRANPDLEPGEPLPEGTLVRVPEPKQIRSEHQEPPPPPPPVKTTRQAAPEKTVKPGRTTVADAGKGRDRLVLGGPEEAAKPKSRGSSPQASLSEMEQRIARMEATLSLLNQELEKMNSALLLTAQALEAEQKLQMSRNLATSPAPPSQPAAVQSTALPAERQNDKPWRDLLLSALLGGGIAIGLAQYLGRRRQPTAESELPLSLSAYRPTPRPEAHRGRPRTKEPSEAKSDAATASQAPGDDQSILELAEVMLSYGRIQGAAETLANHMETTSPDDIHPWNMLLDWYRRGNMRDEFDVLAERMHKLFNSRVPAWDETSTGTSGLKSLEDYSHVIDQTIQTWGTQACMDYLHQLVHDTRAGQRMGFPLEIVEEIALLMHLLEKGHGQTRPG